MEEIIEEKIFKISKTIARAKALKEMAAERLIDIKIENKVYKIIEQYYEIIKELITAIMYTDGFKTLSHKSLITYLKDNYNGFSTEEIILIDEIRRLRNDIVYYGRKIDKFFLLNKENNIKKIIKELFGILNKKLK